MTARYYGLEISTCADLFSFNQDQIGVPVVDTVEFDLKEVLFVVEGQRCISFVLLCQQ